jgi:hypothetical protein
MTQKDTKGRSAYQICADYDLYSVLQTPEIGTIVQKMWNGKLSHDGLLAYSSVWKYLDSSGSRTFDPFENFESFDQTKTYFHQLSLWMESSSLRYWPESVSTILLIFIYNYFIYFLVYRTTHEQTVKKIMQPISEIDDRDLKMLAYLYIFWTLSIVLNIPLQFLFGFFSGRKYRIDKWGYVEIAMFISSLGLLVDTTKIFPSKDEYGNMVPSDGQSDNAFILRAVILSINDGFVWLRVTGIFLTFKNLGPLIRMIYFLSQKTLKYLFIYALYMACFATVYTAIFNNSSDQFNQFSTSLTNLFECFINNPNAFGFYEYPVFGAVSVTVFTTFSGLLLSNLLIAVLSNEYEVLSNVVDAAHRSVLISYFMRYKWDKENGYLIFLTTPLNIVNFIAFPFSWFFRKKYFNKIVCRIYYSVFYLPIIVLLQLCLTTILCPFAYLKGVVMIVSHMTSHRSGLFSKIMAVLSWIIFGLLFVFIMNVRDIILILKTVFIQIDMVSYEKNRIQKYISKDDIRIFLQFIHNRDKDDNRDLHSLFLDYLTFDQDHKAKTDSSIKEKSAYMKRLKSAAGLNLKKKSSRQQASIIIYNNKSSNHTSNLSEQETTGSSIIKRNLIIIEILENFLIDDGSDNFIVDIEKLKMLLPKTMNINDSYLKRILHTDINVLNKAVTKLKTKKNKFVQNKLLNKIVGATIRLDHIVDNEDKKDPLHKESEKKRHKFEVDEVEDDFYPELHGLITKISIDLKKSISNAKNKRFKNEELEMNKNSTLHNELEVEAELQKEREREMKIYED